MGMRNSAWFLSFLAALILLLGALLAHARFDASRSAAELARRAELVRRLGLTDLCLFTEASYTRHPAVTDRATPFQEYPASLEHFPTGSLVGPPDHLTVRHVPGH